MAPYDPGEGVPLDVYSNRIAISESVEDPDADTSNQPAQTLEQHETGHHDSSDFRNVWSEHRFIGPGRFNVRAEILSLPWMKEHGAVRQALLTYSTCNHSSDNNEMCSTCRHNLETSYIRIHGANPVLSNLCEELSFDRNVDESTLKNSCIL